MHRPVGALLALLLIMVGHGAGAQTTAPRLQGFRVAFLGASPTEHGVYPDSSQTDGGKLRYDAWGFSTWAEILGQRNWYTDWSLFWTGDTRVMPGGPSIDQRRGWVFRRVDRAWGVGGV